MSFLDIMRTLTSLYMVGGEPELRFIINGDTYSIKLNDKSCSFGRLWNKDSEVIYSDFIELYQNAAINGISLSECWNSAERVTFDGHTEADYAALLDEYKGSPACKERIDRRKKDFIHCKSHRITELFPDIVEQIRIDLSYGFSVLGIPERKICIEVSDYSDYGKEGICAMSDPGVNCFLYNLDYRLIDNEVDRAELSFATWGVLRLWFHGKAIGEYKRNKVFLPNVTEEDVVEWGKSASWYSSYTKEERARVTASRRYTYNDMYAFALMLTKRQYPGYEENSNAKAEPVQSRLRLLSEIY